MRDEIKNYEEMYTGRTVSYLQIALNIGILVLFFQAIVHYHYVHARILRKNHFYGLKSFFGKFPCGFGGHKKCPKLFIQLKENSIIDYNVI